MSERGEKALAAFHHPYNCAQTIGVAYAGKSDPVELAAQLKDSGGGRAVKCGALIGAQRVGAASGLNPEEIEARFASRLGRVNCRELKAAGVPCAECVRAAAETLEELSVTTLKGRDSGQG